MTKKSRQGGRPVFLVIGILFLLISLVLCICLIVQQREYDRQVDAVDDIKDKVVSTLPSDDGIQVVPDSTDPIGSGDGSDATEPEPDRVYIDANFLRKVDFEQLQSINSRASRWLYIPDTPIDAYVLQEPKVGEYYYLYRDINNDYSSIGSLLTPKIPMDADDAHLLVFGHTFSSSTDLGFGSIKIEFGDADTAAEHPYVYMYYPDRVERWQVWSVCDVKAYDSVYDMPYVLGTDEYDAMLNDVVAKSRYQLCERPSVWTKTLFLSTCNGRYGGSDVRLVLACVPDVAYYYETKQIVSFGQNLVGSQGGANAH